MTRAQALTALKRFGPAVVILALGAAALLGGLGHYISLDQLRARREALEALVAARPILSLGLYLGVYVACISLSLPAALVLTLTGGFLFGGLEGGLAAAVGCTLGSVVVFLAGRTAMGDLMRRRAGPTAARIEAGVRSNAFLYVVSLRLIPVMPFWLVNLASGLVEMPLRTFMAATLVGILPASLIYATLGSELHGLFRRGEHVEPGFFLRPLVLIPLSCVALLSLAPLVWRRLRPAGRRDGGPA
jgi:uncharacterized membrane protein YdjX (TVP38/TMEM64 family)